MAKADKKPKATEGERPKGGRPSKYSDDVLEAICSRLARGEPLTVICRDDDMPADRTVRDWIEADPNVSAAIARAREDGFDALAAQCLEIAEDGSCDYVLSKTGPLVDSEHVQRSKLRIDTRLKLLAKWDPKRYGDKVQLAGHEGQELPAPTFTVLPVAVLKSE